MQEIFHQNITLLLEDCINGKKGAVDELLPHVYKELRLISSKYLRDENRNHTLQTTELVHEAYIKLVGDQNISWQSRAHFFGIAAQSMRQILVDHARKRKSLKRGEGIRNISLDDVFEVSEKADDQLLALNEALKKLEAVEERSSKIVELRYFSGLTIEETAEVLKISTATAKRDWNFAKAWLYREIASN
ncbi:MAG: sigma-70 family RNA polymerase sigma factor [Ignavibacterium sp.]|jgi:RNA polymerase sigma factor (TIGR02999 family)|nr:sigma-70 family RNA polymerase sigma factor [Ignavibacterium sp.]